MKTAILALALSFSVAGAAVAQEKKAPQKASSVSKEQKESKPSGYFVTQGSKVIDVSKKDLRIQNALYSEYND